MVVSGTSKFDKKTVSCRKSQPKNDSVTSRLSTGFPSAYNLFTLLVRPVHTFEDGSSTRHGGIRAAIVDYRRHRHRSQTSGMQCLGVVITSGGDFRDVHLDLNRSTQSSFVHLRAPLPSIQILFNSESHTPIVNGCMSRIHIVVKAYSQSIL